MKAELIFSFKEEKVKFPVEWSNHDIIDLSLDKNPEGVYFEDMYDSLWKKGNPDISVVAENGDFSVAQYEELSGMFYSIDSLKEV